MGPIVAAAAADIQVAPFRSDCERLNCMPFDSFAQYLHSMDADANKCDDEM